MIPTLHGPERKLTEVQGPTNGSVLSWLPNGKWLVTSDKELDKRSFSLILISVDTGEKRRLTSPPAGWLGDLYPAISPDGHTVAFARSASGDIHRNFTRCRSRITLFPQKGQDVLPLIIS